MLNHIDQISEVNKTILETSKSQSEVDVKVGRNLEAINEVINKLANEIHSASEISDSLKSSAGEVQEQIQAFKVS